ncbi:MAG: hypothetical protein PHY59_03585 [Methanobacterium sp.]|nr:hypothetical protein [Methanobacterium sp.]
MAIKCEYCIKAHKENAICWCYYG